MWFTCWTKLAMDFPKDDAPGMPQGYSEMSQGLDKIGDGFPQGPAQHFEDLECQEIQEITLIFNSEIETK